MLALDGGELAMKNVTILVDAGGAEVFGLIIQNQLDNPPADLDNVSIRLINGSANAYGMLAAYGAAQVVFRNGTIDVACSPSSPCWGLDANGVTVRNSEIRSTWGGVRGARVIGSRIEGTAQSVGGGLVSFSEVAGGPVGTGTSCFNVHDESFNAVTCP
jgi:hypothetical protein